MNEDTKNKLNKEADRIQPDKVFEELTKNYSEDGKKLYKDMEKLYNELCEKDISFSLFFTDSQYNTNLFWRICPIEIKEDQKKYENILCSQLDKMYNFLYYAGYIGYLEKRGEIRILRKPQILTTKEQLDIKE